MIWRLLLVAGFVISLAACESTRYTKDPATHTITIHNGIGGAVKSIERRYIEWKSQGWEVVVAGEVGSADAIMAMSYPGACYTERAVWMPKAYSDLAFLGLRRLPGYTERGARMLPKELGDWWRNHHSFYDTIGHATVRYPQLLQIWPAGACDKDDADAARADSNWKPALNSRTAWLIRYEEEERR